MRRTNPARLVVQRHMDAFLAGDATALVSDYALHPIFISSRAGVVTDRAELQARFEKLFREVFPPGKTQTTFKPMIIQRDVVLLEWESIGPEVQSVASSDVFIITHSTISVHVACGQYVRRMQGGDAAVSPDCQRAR